MRDFYLRRAWRRRHRYNGSMHTKEDRPIRLNFAVRSHVGLARGTNYQFAVGAGPGEIGESVVFSDVAFCFLEPYLRRIHSDLHPMARYGTAVLPNPVCVALAAALRREAPRLRRLRYATPLQRRRGASPPSTAKAMLAFPPFALWFDDWEIAGEFARNPLRYFELARLFERLAEWLDRTAVKGQVISLLGI